MSLSNRVSVVILVEERLLIQVNGMKRFMVYEESSGKSNSDRSTRSVSCGYELILYACNMHMFMLWTCNVEGYINRMKAV